jgi:hypothetical protein
VAPDEVEERMKREAESAAYLSLFKRLTDAQRNGMQLVLSKDDVARVQGAFVEAGGMRILKRELALQYMPREEILEILGVKFTVDVFQNFGVNTGEDDCYYHVHGDGGLVTVTRTTGHRTMLRRMREALEESPCSCQRIVPISGPGPLVPPARCLRCEILAQIPDSIASEAMALHALVERSREFRETTKADPDAADWARKQMESVGRLFGALEMLDAIYAQQHREKGGKLIVEPGAPA